MSQLAYPLEAFLRTWVGPHHPPRAVVPELDCVIANLELMPLRMNESKNAKIGSRQRSLAVKLHGAGLLSEVGLRAVKESR